MRKPGERSFSSTTIQVMGWTVRCSENFGVWRFDRVEGIGLRVEG